MRLAPTKNGFSRISLPKAGLRLRQGRRNWHGEPKGAISKIATATLAANGRAVSPGKTKGSAIR